ncbi:mitochondrial import receptor subunit Tom22 [Coemansia sp. RSA 1813]|nr:mitochondrial import receptor subunit Tom22 [Coemansia sp. RSA 1646]KAJ1771769.1 mitochondrial import receptor subunit Tom22 [Coemansia sp. RSA 1843]KAJ2093406.1 mitochondrial import receptor subunit Tom22 [Coemansia sp. RSA 986]KAJ2217213.1 mitochondrial import receptor subunit Tom22 [Coemansia sp. RSA 487]KAJ2572412.1 mitochondrial import receptor subunit Tom22 [Coemansia sp. RSA 1813]
MVKVVQIEDQSDYESDSQYTTDDESVATVDEKEDEYSDDDLDSEFDDEDDSLDESLLERLAALKDIVPASQRNAVSNAAGAVAKWGGLGATLAGKLAWVFTTSALLVVFPLAFESDREKMMMEQWGNGDPEQAGMAAAPPQGQMMSPGVAPGLAPGHA